MGPKITIDSSTLMNKGLEVIEAHELFDVDFDRIEVVVHPQSVVHGMVTFHDGATIAQLSMPDMRLPIGLALGAPARLDQAFGPVDWATLASLTFETPDLDAFPCLSLAYAAGRAGGGAPATLSGANEVAVEAFLAGRIAWTTIAQVVDEVLQHGTGNVDDVGDVLEVDRVARTSGRGRRDRETSCCVKDPLGDDAPPVETRKAVVGISLMVVAIIVLVALRPSTAVTVAIIVGLVLTIMLHEFGHYVAAKKSGMKVTEFFLGFGPRIWSFRRGETEYGIKAIPAGGYVRIIGMTNLEEVDPEDEPRTYRQATTGKRLITVLAGIIVNLLIALVLVFGILVLHGPEDVSTTIDGVAKGSPAAIAGLRSGDRIVAIDGSRITDWNQVGRAITPNQGKPITFTVERDGRDEQVTATPKLIDGAPRVGITAAFVSHRMNPVARRARELRDHGSGRLGHRRRARQGVLGERARALRQVGDELQGRLVRPGAAAVGRRYRGER